MTIGVFGRPADPEVKTLQRRIVNRGVECRIVDLSRFPEWLALTIGERIGTFGNRRQLLIVPLLMG